MSTETETPCPEVKPEGYAQKLNWLRAGVLGANDGIVSIAAVVVGVAGAVMDRPAIIAAGLAALVGGAISMALGEYVSVSSQRDSERACMARGELTMDESEIVSPWHAAFASAIAFLAGGIWPLLAAIVVTSGTWKVPVICLVALGCLAVAGKIASMVGQSDAGKATIRMIIGGALALAVTWGLGALFGATGI